MTQSVSTPDAMETFHGATIQHGPFSNRIYVMKAGEESPESLTRALCGLARERGYTKIFAKLPASHEAAFVDSGFRTEARVSGYFLGGENAVMMGLFLDEARARPADPDELDRVLEIARLKAGAGEGISAKIEGGAIRPCLPADAEAMAAIYRDVFPTYPFPIYDPSYLVETMKTHIAYFGAEIDGELAALASSEMDLGAKAVEMTDFATLPAWLGRGCAVKLLAAMEGAMRERGIVTAFTIARAVSPGMNVTFAKLGYEFNGRLVNNTQISGSIESMNVWSKAL